MGTQPFRAGVRCGFIALHLTKKTFSEYQPWAATVPGAGDTKIQVTAPARKVLPLHEGERQSQGGYREARTGPSRSTGVGKAQVDRESDVQATSSSSSKGNRTGFLNQGGSPEGFCNHSHHNAAVIYLQKCASLQNCVFRGSQEPDLIHL